MRRPELDLILNSMLESQPEVSDLLFTVDKPLQVESFGELKPVAFDPPIESLTPFQTEMIALNLIGENHWHAEDLLRRGSCDAAYTLADKARFRINIFSQRGNYSIVCRQLNACIPTLIQMGFPEIFKLIPKEKTGLAEGGKVSMPLAKTFWSAKFGMLADAFGAQWMLSCPPTE